MSSINEAKASYQRELDKLSGYVQKSYKARVKWLKTGHPLKVIEAEIGVALAGNRMDLVENLMERRRNLIIIQKEISRLDYEQRFGSGVSSTPLPEDPIDSTETDSTQFSSDTKREVAQTPNQ